MGIIVSVLGQASEGDRKVWGQAFKTDKQTKVIFLHAFLILLKIYGFHAKDLALSKKLPKRGVEVPKSWVCALLSPCSYALIIAII